MRRSSPLAFLAYVPMHRAQNSHRVMTTRGILFNIANLIVRSTVLASIACIDRRDTPLALFIDILTASRVISHD